MQYCDLQKIKAENGKLLLKMMMRYVKIQICSGMAWEEGFPVGNRVPDAVYNRV